MGSPFLIPELYCNGAMLQVLSLYINPFCQTQFITEQSLGLRAVVEGNFGLLE